MPRFVIAARRQGFTLIELLVVIAVIAVLVGLLLPAVQKVREAASRTQCANNLKQLGLALVQYHDERRGFPPAYVNKGPYGTTGFSFTHGWAAFVLPYIEQRPLADLYRWDVPLYAPENDPVISKHLALFQCPSTPEPSRYMTFGPYKAFGTKGACGDYTITLGVDAALAQLGSVDSVGDYRGALTNTPTPAVALSPASTGLRFAEITDGASNTILLAEDAGRPRLWQLGKADAVLQVEGGPWNHFKGPILLQGKTGDGTSKPGRCALNCTNDREVYAFHSGGANVGFGDGAVRFLRAGMDIRIMARLITRAGGEVVSADGF